MFNQDRQNYRKNAISNCREGVIGLVLGAVDHSSLDFEQRLPAVLLPSLHGECRG